MSNSSTLPLNACVKRQYSTPAALLGAGYVAPRADARAQNIALERVSVCTAFLSSEDDVNCFITKKSVMYPKEIPSEEHGAGFEQ